MSHSTFFYLIREAIRHQNYRINEDIDWQVIYDVAAQQGLTAVILDGIEQLPETMRPPQNMLLEWIGEVLQGYEYTYDLYTCAIAEMSHFYNTHGYKMMVLKGYACSLDWPRPEHRPCGDIDIWLFGKQEEADALMAREQGIEIDNSHHHHTVFNWHGFAVENHYDFINVYHHKSHTKLERIFKELASDDTHHVELYGEKVYLPSPNLHALFLLKHTMLHFVSGEMNLRQLLDWAFFVEKHTKEIDWVWLKGVLDDFGMTPAFNIFNAICVDDLGFDETIFPEANFNITIKEKALTEFFVSESTNEGPKGKLSNVYYRYRRWRASEWKHELCYKESMRSAFWSGIYGHLLKPASI